jgi:mRNA interferase RelE/StbE
VIYTVGYSSEAVIQLEKFDKTVTKRILKKIENAAVSPHNFFRQLKGRPEYKLRVGDYRVIANIDEPAKRILIRTVGHRKNIYNELD